MSTQWLEKPLFANVSRQEFGLFHTFTPHVNRLLKVLRQSVPNLRFHARMVGGNTRSVFHVYIFGVRETGEVVGGYEHLYLSSLADSRKEGMVIAHFFLVAQTAEAAVYEPPEIRDLWESRYLRELMFPELVGRR